MKRIVLFGLLALAVPAQAQQSAKITLNFPPMAIVRIAPGLLQTAKEPCTGTLVLDTGVVLTVTTDSIPATYVRGLGLRKVVDACVATGKLSDGGTIVVNLPPEPVVLVRGVYTASAINCPTVITLANGVVLRGTTYGPACPTRKIGPGRFLAVAVTYAGSVSR